MSITVRQAVAADALAATHILRRSISQLCVADHRNDPVRLESWLQNKTVSSVVAWIASVDNYCVVASINDSICGFGAMTVEGEIMLCYVDPTARFRGVSAAMLDELEHKARGLGLPAVHLNGTATARRFYEDRGYIPAGQTNEVVKSMACQSMVKRFAP